jgi:hypothetical protein
MQYKRFKILKLYLIIQIKFFFMNNFVLKLNLASIISVRPTILREKGRIWIRVAQKLTDPDPWPF